MHNITQEKMGKLKRRENWPNSAKNAIIRGRNRKRRDVYRSAYGVNSHVRDV